jgi:hypothetical protein
VDRTNYWNRQLKQRTKKLEQAEAELYNVTLTSPRESHAFQKMAVLKARRMLEEAEAKVLVLKQWRQKFDNRATPLLRQLDPMFFLVGRKLPEGIHALGESIKALQAYAEKFPSPAIKPAVRGRRRAMSASGSRGLLTLATRQLLSRWEETQHSWRDRKAAEFESLYLAEIRNQVNSAMKVLEDLDQLLEKIHADCD